MKKSFLILLFNSALCIVNCAFSQNPLVKIWDKRYGGTQGDLLTSFKTTKDHGFILGGYSFSAAGGDKTQSTWTSWDYWIVKTDSLGNKEWDKDFGGTGLDYLYSVNQTSDGGYILGGTSGSSIGGDKTENNRGNTDFWIIKTDSLGNKLWDKDFGGSDVDYLSMVMETSDHGFILGGLSLSGISGDKSQNTIGISDYWILKTDSMGNKLWDRDFGGTDDDQLFSILQTTDGGYVLGGYSHSNIGGDKTQPCMGAADYWVIKTDASGNKIWDADFGGSDPDILFSILQTGDEGFLLGGISFSDISGNKSSPSHGSADIWLVKTDSTGAKQWENDYGGLLGEDELGNISVMNDGGYLIGGTSYSSISGDKTENNLGIEQTWVLKIDSSGNKIWDKTVFTGGHDEIGYIQQTTDGCYAIANYEYGGIAGYKTEDNWDPTDVSSDYWMVKFCETLQANFISTPDLCPGTCTNFINTSTNAVSYQWSFPGANPVLSTDANPTNICYYNPGSYNITLIATNATGSDTLTLNNYITVFPFPAPQGITQNGDTLFANPGSAGYQWYMNGSMISGATNYFYVATSSGNYNVVATDLNGCEVEAAISNVIAGLSSASIASVEEIKTFPDPVKDNLSVCFPASPGNKFDLKIYNLFGELIYSTTDVSDESGKNPLLTINSKNISIDCSHFPPGLYTIEINSQNKIAHGSFIKQ